MKLKDLWVWVVVDLDGETIASMTRTQNDRVTFFPLIGDEERARQLEPAAQAVADQTGRPVRLIQMMNRVDRQTLTPRTEPT